MLTRRLPARKTRHPDQCDPPIARYHPCALDLGMLTRRLPARKTRHPDQCDPPDRTLSPLVVRLSAMTACRDVIDFSPVIDYRP
jgi:hypothetical protein